VIPIHWPRRHEATWLEPALWRIDFPALAVAFHGWRDMELMSHLPGMGKGKGR
jgi:hypothetical protein